MASRTGAPMSWIVRSIRENPELAIFLTLAIGFVLGRIRIGSFRLGNVVGTLLAGVLVGQLGVEIHPLVKVVFFDLFLFATGYKVGPQFFRGLRKNALSQAILTVVLCVVSLVTTVVAAKVMGYDLGIAAGLLAGAFTESTVIGTAGNAISALPLADAEKTRLMNNIPVAYAVSYLVGTSFVVWFLSSLAPRLMRVDLKEEAPQARSQAARAARPRTASRVRPIASGTCAPSGCPTPSTDRRSRRWSSRSLRRASSCPAFAAARRSSTPLPTRFSAPATSSSSAPAATSCWRSARPFGAEVEDRDLLDFPMVALDLVVTRKELAEKSLDEIAEEHGRGVALSKLIRGGEEIPFAAATRIQSRRPAARRGRRARRRAGGQGDRLRRAPVERDRRGLRRPRHPARRTVRRPDAQHRRPADQPHGERRRAHHGTGLRLAALGAPDLRTDSGARALGLRHDRARRLHRLRRHQRRPELRLRPASRPVPGLMVVGILRRPDSARDRRAVRQGTC